MDEERSFSFLIVELCYFRLFWLASLLKMARGDDVYQKPTTYFMPSKNKKEEGESPYDGFDNQSPFSQ